MNYLYWTSNLFLRQEPIFHRYDYYTAQRDVFSVWVKGLCCVFVPSTEAAEYITHTMKRYIQDSMHIYTGTGLTQILKGLFYHSTDLNSPLGQLNTSAYQVSRSHCCLELVKGSHNYSVMHVNSIVRSSRKSIQQSFLVKNGCQRKLLNQKMKYDI